MRRRFLLFVTLFLLWAVDCTKNPSGPITPEGTSVYIPFQNKVFIIDSSKDQIVDSIVFNFNISDLKLSPNEKILYLQKWHIYPDTATTADFAEVDIETKKILYEGQNSSLFITPDGRYLVSTIQGLQVFSSSTHELVYQNPLEVRDRPTFDPQMHALYVPLKDNRILAFDYRSLSVIKFLTALTDKNLPEIFDILFSEIDNRLYFSLYFSANDTPYTSYLGNIDVTRDRIATLERLDLYDPFEYWSEGYLYSSRSTQKIFMLSGCFCISIPEIAPVNLFGFSTAKQKIVTDLYYNVSPGPASFQITKSGEKAYHSHLWGGSIIIIDLKQNQITGYIRILS